MNMNKLFPNLKEWMRFEVFPNPHSSITWTAVLIDVRTDDTLGSGFSADINEAIESCALEYRGSHGLTIN